jgi:hypothetical protein
MLHAIDAIAEARRSGIGREDDHRTGAADVRYPGDE